MKFSRFKSQFYLQKLFFPETLRMKNVHGTQGEHTGVFRVPNKQHESINVAVPKDDFSFS